MSEKPIKVPGTDHPISIEPAGVRVTVKFGGLTVAESTSALVLREAKYPSVFYIPSADVDMSHLVASSHTTYCPYKGDCGYHDLCAGDASSHNAVWSYAAPYEAVAAIAGHFAFYPDRVDSIDVSEIPGEP